MRYLGSLVAFGLFLWFIRQQFRRYRLEDATPYEMGPTWRKRFYR